MEEKGHWTRARRRQSYDISTVLMAALKPFSLKATWDEDKRGIQRQKEVILLVHLMGSKLSVLHTVSPLNYITAHKGAQYCSHYTSMDHDTEAQRDSGWWLGFFLPQFLCFLGSGRKSASLLFKKEESLRQEWLSTIRNVAIRTNVNSIEGRQRGSLPE